MCIAFSKLLTLTPEKNKSTFCFIDWAKQTKSLLLLLRNALNKCKVKQGKKLNEPELQSKKLTPHGRKKPFHFLSVFFSFWITWLDLHACLASQSFWCECLAFQTIYVLFMVLGHFFLYSFFLNLKQANITLQPTDLSLLPARFVVVVAVVVRVSFRCLYVLNPTHEKTLPQRSTTHLIGRRRRYAYCPMYRSYGQFPTVIADLFAVFLRTVCEPHYRFSSLEPIRFEW